MLSLCVLWESQEWSVLFRRHLGCYVADCACPLRKRNKTGMERSGPTPTAIRQGSWPGRSGAGGAPAYAAERICFWTASHYIRTLARVCLYMISECAPIRRVRSTSPSLACWPGSAGERGTGTATMIPRLGSHSDFTCVQPMDRDYLTCLAWLTLWSSWCNNGAPPNLLPPATPRAQPVPADRLPGLRLSAGLMAHQTLPGLNCSAAPLRSHHPSTHFHPLNLSLTGLST